MNGYESVADCPLNGPIYDTGHERQDADMPNLTNVPVDYEEPDRYSAAVRKINALLEALGLGPINNH